MEGRQEQEMYSRRKPAEMRAGGGSVATRACAAQRRDRAGASRALSGAVGRSVDSRGARDHDFL